MKKQINSLSAWVSNLFENDGTDEIKGCIDIIFKNHTTEQSIHIFAEVKKAYEQELTTRYDSNLRENGQIKTYFVSVKE